MCQRRPRTARSRKRMSGLDLTPRQHEVLRLVARGDSNDEIAAALAIRPRTAAWHVTQLMTRFDVPNRAALVAAAAAAGLLDTRTQ